MTNGQGLVSKHELRAEAAPQGGERGGSRVGAANAGGTCAPCGSPLKDGLGGATLKE